MALEEQDALIGDLAKSPEDKNRTFEDPGTPSQSQETLIDDNDTPVEGHSKQLKDKMSSVDD